MRILGTVFGPVLGTVFGTVFGPVLGTVFGPVLGTLPAASGLLLLASLGACTSPAPAPGPAAGASVAAADPATAAAAGPPSPVEPIVAAPAPDPTPTAEPAPAPAPTTACDPTGTWRLAIIANEGGCEVMRGEIIDLAFAFTGDADAPSLAVAVKSIGDGDALAKLTAEVRAARVAVPGEGCRIRVVMGAAASTHAELLLPLAAEFSGSGTLWTKKGARPCRQSFGVLATRSGPKPAAWAELGPAVAAPGLPAPKPAPPGVIESTARIDAAALFTGARARKPAVPLAGSIVDYVAAVVGKPEDVSLHEVVCSSAAASTTVNACVAIVGDPCRPKTNGEDEDCEGMYLTVVVGPARGALDRADAGGYPVESQADIEERLEMAP